jgi:hypothetical protein
MNIVMSISSSETDTGSAEAEYADEVMNAEWNPAVDQMCQLQKFESANKLTAPQTDIFTVDADLLMHRLYIYQ